MRFLNGQLMYANGSRWGTVFIAFSSKSDDGDLISELQAALTAWRPPPSRLFLAKLRAEVDEFGVVAQEAALGNNNALAYWYERLLDTKEPERRWHISDSVARQSEQLLNPILSNVEGFASRLLKAESRPGAAIEICKRHFKVDLGNKAAKLTAIIEHNAFVCSKKPEGWHLTTGHIFTMQDEYWICLSPACDMVPAQLSSDRILAFGNRIPFIGIKLHEVSIQKPHDALSSRFLYIYMSGEIKAFCFNNPGDDNSAPIWHVLYAERKGQFGKTFDFTALRTRAGTRRLVSQKCSAIVVSQLRYEYALNLLQKLGTSLTRIGLDFAAEPKDKKKVNN